ncbi:DNA mismatch repair protein MSH2 [Camellia lanceoleosa]|uniref:DNA mismatch repair protein MSH2 n=1 Tax=Camellia lanceoleosa TaxID=1840588 RepID=A0ACC0H5K4_9ERIC|nr:DNA mismatch repair protein MSH2 [Camellia lanceoleosa]
MNSKTKTKRVFLTTPFNSSEILVFFEMGSWDSLLNWLSRYKPLHDTLSRCGVMVTERKKTEFEGRDLVQDLGRLVRGSVEPVRDLVSGFEFAPGVLGSSLSYVELLAEESNYGSYSIRKYNLHSYV